MPEKNQAALEFLLARKSYPAKMMAGPVPTDDELAEILTAAARTPDHGKLEPWRFIVLRKPALTRLAQAIAARGPQLGIAPEKIEKPVATYGNAGLAVVVVAAPVALDKIPLSEQIYSAGAVCLAMVNAATAAGWAANWLSGWFSHDRQFVENELGLAPHESVAGIIHIGTPTTPAPERPRPDVVAKTTWMDS